MKIILEKISDGIDLSSLSQEERDRYIVERTDRGIVLAQAGAVPSNVVTFMLANYIKLNWRGAWSSESTYNYNDAVSYLGSSYVALRATTEQPSESAADWKLIAKKGEDGRGIVSFDLFDVQEKTKIYRLLYTDATYVDIAIIDGNDGVDGLTPYIGMNGNWWIGDVDQNIKAEGVDGISPTIGLNGNWYLGETDTGVKAAGTGAYNIYLAGGGTLSEVDFNAAITDIPAHIADATKHIDTTTAEFSGTIDETNDKFTIWDNSLLKWIRYSFTSLKTYLNGIYHKFGGSSFGEKQIIGSTDNQDFGIITNNIERLTVLKDGKVGIGTINPLAKLHLVDGNMYFSGASNGVATINPNIYNVMIGPKQARFGVGNYMPGIAFNHLLNWGGSPTYDAYAQAWIGTRVTNVTGSELADLVFATKTTIGTGSGNYATEKMTITSDGNVGIGKIKPESKLQVAGGIQCGDDTSAASANKVGTTRYRATANASYVEMCMQVGASSYSWITIVTNTW